MALVSLRTRVSVFLFWCARALQLQLFLTLFSLPILVAWGLPISCVSPVGNCLFAPFLILFLLFSSCIFFGQLLHLPCSLFAYVLNYITESWLLVMNYGSTRWLVGIAQLPLPFLIIIGLLPFCIVGYKPTRSLFPSIVCFSTILLSIYLYTSATLPAYQIIKIPCARAELTFISTPHTTVLIDPGCLGSMVSASTWARYTLTPELIRRTGSTRINHLIILQPMGLCFEALEQLCTLFFIDTIYIPQWQGTMKKSHLRRYAQLQRMTTATHTNIVRIDPTTSITIPDTEIIIGIIQGKDIRINEITFPAHRVQAQIDNTEVTIYPAKYVIPKEKSNYKRKFQQK